MGTRGLWGFVIDGEEKLTYNHFDSYPDGGLGDFLVEEIAKVGGATETLANQVRSLQMVTKKSRPTAAQQKALRKYANFGVSSQSANDWYCLLRETQGDMRATLDAGYMIEGKSFGEDSLFCEYGYILDLDNEVFEVYRGFCKEPHEGERFSYATPQESACSGNKYYGIKCVGKFPLWDIPQDWKERSFPDYYEDEDDDDD